MRGARSIRVQVHIQRHAVYSVYFATSGISFSLKLPLRVKDLANKGRKAPFWEVSLLASIGEPISVKFGIKSQSNTLLSRATFGTRMVGPDPS